MAGMETAAKDRGFDVATTLAPGRRWAAGPMGRSQRPEILPLPGEAAAVFRRVRDVLVALGLLAGLAPLLAAIALLIRLDSPGPILFRQRREGRGQRVFSILKFRTMRVAPTDEACLRQTSRGDSRITSIGAFLRRSSLDELPQLLNVLAGTMSLVGPRPHALGMRIAGRELEDIDPRYRERHRIRPGITGLAQTGGCRGPLDTEEKLRRRIDLDLAYIAGMSPWLDALIIWRTARQLFGDADAF